jgi:poly(3-hydroxybutyrate) depolymerase
MTLMAGPIDARVSPTEVNEFAVSKSLKWFENPGDLDRAARYAAAAAAASIPGFLQLTAFMSDEHGAAPQGA